MVCSVICNYSNSQLYIHFENILTDISDLRVDSIKARFQIKVKSLISCMCQYITLLEQLSLVSLVFLYLQYIFFFVNFALLMRDLLELETRSKHFLPTSSATSCNKKDCFIIHKLTLKRKLLYNKKAKTEQVRFLLLLLLGFYIMLELCSCFLHVFLTEVP